MHRLMNFGIIVPMGLADEIKRRALELGFDLVGVTDASPIDASQVQFFADWLKFGFAGQMQYMHRNFEKRIDPASLLQGARSIICVGLNYKPATHSPSLRARHSRARQSHHDESEIASPAFGGLAMTEPMAPVGRVAMYAQYEDYHPFMKKRLRALVEFVSATASPGHKFKVCVDSVPLAERALAVRAGLGFIGKNHTLINPTLGPQIFLGEIVTTVQLQPDEQTPCHPAPTSTEALPYNHSRPTQAPHAPRSERSEAPSPCHSERSEAEPRNLLPKSGAAPAEQELAESTTSKCATCNNCVEACPTGAMRPDGQFDANRCISYLTIEYKGQIPADLAERIGDRLFGCDECVLACPYQRNAPTCKNQEFAFHSDRARLDLRQILDMKEKDFNARFADSPIKHLGLQGLKRNARICLENM